MANEVDRLVEVYVKPPGHVQRLVPVVTDPHKLLEAPVENLLESCLTLCDVCCDHVLPRFTVQRGLGRESSAIRLGWTGRTTRDAARRGVDDETVATCPVCGSWFDDHGYQLVIHGLGSFDSIECADEALRRDAHERRHNRGSVAVAATTQPDGSHEGTVRTDSPVQPDR